MEWVLDKNNKVTLKTTRRFAWFPVMLSNGDVIWLENYYHKQGCRQFIPCEEEWITIEKYRARKDDE